MTTVNLATTLTYTAVPNTDGYPVANHRVVWSFDDNTTVTCTASPFTTQKKWSTAGYHSAVAEATNLTTNASAIATSGITAIEYIRPSLVWGGAAISSDGSIMFIGDKNGPTYRSTDSGARFYALAGSPTKIYSDFACSDDGMVVYSAAGGNQVHVSIDGGDTWTACSSNGVNGSRICCSADGAIAHVCGSGGGSGDYIYSTADYGVTWTQRTSAGSRVWRDISCSSDGLGIMACNNATISGPWQSINGGVSWTTTSNLIDKPVACCVTSGGVEMFACGNSIYAMRSNDSGASFDYLFQTTNLTSISKGGAPGYPKIFSDITAPSVPKRLDSATSLVEMTALGSYVWASAQSRDGLVLLMNNTSGGITTSFDGGVNWE